LKSLSDLKNVGKATLGDLSLLGIHSVEELERRTQQRQDPCVWDVFAAIIDEAKTGTKSNWWDWTTKRKALQKTGKLKH
jgi:hypothetical protein